MRICKCTNNDGVSLEFRKDDFTPWLMTDVTGIYEFDADVYTSDNTMTDGATYQGSTVKKRNIVLTMVDKGDHKYNRELLYTVFKPKSPGVFTYEEGDEVRTIDYYVENVVPGTASGLHWSFTVSLICPDPFFTDTQDTSVLVAGWTGLFEFVHEFKLEALGERSTEKLKTIENDSAADNVGLTLTITATGDATNPSVTRVESQQTMKIGTESKSLTLHAGDILVITTGVNNKHVYLTTDGSTSEINEYLDEKSEFIQLMRGSNTIGYDADSGSEYMNVLCEFRYKYLGV